MGDEATKALRPDDPLQCPSAPIRSQDGRLFAVNRIEADAFITDYLPRAIPMDDTILAMTGDTSPEFVLRVASRCIEAACVHWSDARCNLVDAVIDDLLPSEVKALPRCAIRRSCRWFAQEGPQICRRCHQVARRERVSNGDGLRAETFVFGLPEARQHEAEHQD